MSQIEITDQNRPHCPLCGEAQRRMAFFGYYEDIHAWVCGCSDRVKPDGQVVGCFVQKSKGMPEFRLEWVFLNETATEYRFEWREVSE